MTVEILIRAHDAKRPCRTHLQRHLQEELGRTAEGLPFDRYFKQHRYFDQRRAVVLLLKGLEAQLIDPSAGESVKNEHVADLCDLRDQLEAIMAVRS